MMESRVTFCLLVKNEEANLRELIPQLKRSGSTIIAADTGSTDGTLPYLDSEKIHTLHVRWENDFAKARSVLLREVQTEWVFMIDADERLTPELEKDLDGIRANGGEYNGYLVPRKNYYLGSWLRFGGQYPDCQLKIFRKNKTSFDRNVHEKTIVDGKTGTLQGHLLHYSYPSVSVYLKKFDLYTDLEAEGLWEKGLRPSLHKTVRWLFIKPAMRFVRRYIFKLGLLDGIPGLFAATFDVLGIIVRYYKLYEISKQRKSGT